MVPALARPVAGHGEVQHLDRRPARRPRPLVERPLQRAARTPGRRRPPSRRRSSRPRSAIRKVRGGLAVAYVAVAHPQRVGLQVAPRVVDRHVRLEDELAEVVDDAGRAGRPRTARARGASSRVGSRPRARPSVRRRATGRRRAAARSSPAPSARNRPGSQVVAQRLAKPRRRPRAPPPGTRPQARSASVTISCRSASRVGTGGRPHSEGSVIPRRAAYQDCLPIKAERVLTKPTRMSVRTNTCCIKMSPCLASRASHAPTLGLDQSDQSRAIVVNVPAVLRPRIASRRGASAARPWGSARAAAARRAGR